MVMKNIKLAEHKGWRMEAWSSAGISVFDGTLFSQ